MHVCDFCFEKYYIEKREFRRRSTTYLLLGEGEGQVGVEALVLFQEVVREDGRVAVGDEPVVQLGGLVVQQDAGGGGPIR